MYFNKESFICVKFYGISSKKIFLKNENLQYYNFFPSTVDMQFMQTSSLLFLILLRKSSTRLHTYNYSLCMSQMVVMYFYEYNNNSKEQLGNVQRVLHPSIQTAIKTTLMLMRMTSNIVKLLYTSLAISRSDLA